MSGAEALTREDDIDVGGIFVALRRKWWLIALLSVLTGAVLLVTLSMVSPRYKSSARILIRDGDNAFTRSTRDQTVLQAGGRFDQAAIRSFVEVIGSDKIALRVIDELDLTEKAEFSDKPGLMDLVSAMLNFGAGDDYAIAGPKDIALKKYKERLKVYALLQTRVIVIEFWSHDAKLAQSIVKRLSESYIEEQRDRGMESSEEASIFLDPRVEELEANIVRTEQAVAEFRASSDILLSNNNNSLLATEQLSQASSELSRVRTERSSAEAKVNTIKSALGNGSSLEIVPDVIQSSLIQRLREREVEIKAQISDLSTSLLPNHPRMKALQSQLADFQNQIRRAANNIVRSLEGNVEQARETELGLEQRIIKLKAEAARVDEKLVELRALEREAEAAKVLLADYKNRSLEAKTRSGLAEVDAEIISPANLSIKPFFPQIMPITIVGMLGAAVLTSLGIITASLLSAVGGVQRREAMPRIPEPNQRDNEAVSEYDNRVSPEIAAEPEFRTEEGPASKQDKMPERKFSDDIPVGHTGGDYRSYDASQGGNGFAKFEQQYVSELLDGHPKLNMEQAISAIQQTGGGQIAVLTPGRGDGSLASLELARALHLTGLETVLVDLSADGICSRKALGEGDLPGFFDLICGEAQAGEVIFLDRQSGASVVPAGMMAIGAPPVRRDLVQSVITAMEETFDVCIFECGGAEADEVSLVANDNSVLFVNTAFSNATIIDGVFADLQEYGYLDAVLLHDNGPNSMNPKYAA